MNEVAESIELIYCLTYPTDVTAQKWFRLTAPDFAGKIQLCFVILAKNTCLIFNAFYVLLRVLSQPVHGTTTYRCDDTRCCIIQF